jgi:hypothetical protein
VAHVTRNLTESGIMVHAYMMYGYPTQTIQETIDSLEMVRQLFEVGVLQSGFWHQFAMTAHSPIGLNPEEFGVIPKNTSFGEVLFANNDIEFKDKTGINHEKFSFGLKKSLFNYMHGICFEYELQDWFDFKIPRTKIAPDFIISCLEKEANFSVKPTAKVFWIGGKPILEHYTKSKKGTTWQMTKMTFYQKIKTIEINLESEKAFWLKKNLEKISIENTFSMTFSQLKSDFETTMQDFELFWYSKPIVTLRDSGLLVL